jgi:hypothetical protein
VTQHISKLPLDVALEYIPRGWAPIPVPFKGKNPGKGWPDLDITAANVGQYFNGAPQNIGVLMGERSGGLTDIDLDCNEAVHLGPHVLPKTGAVFGRKSTRAAHYLYVTDLHIGTYGKAIEFHDPSRRQDQGRLLLEVRIGGMKRRRRDQGCANRLPRIGSRKRRTDFMG